MKKALLVSCGIILLLMIILVCVYGVQTAPKDIGSFSVGEFHVEMNNAAFQSDRNYGEITNFKSAAKAGKAAVAQRFEDYRDSIFRWMGCDVQYDSNHAAYLVRLYPLSSSVKGGEYIVIMQSDGTVLAIWGGK